MCVYVRTCRLKEEIYKSSGTFLCSPIAPRRMNRFGIKKMLETVYLPIGLIATRSGSDDGIQEKSRELFKYYNRQTFSDFCVFHNNSCNFSW